MRLIEPQKGLVDWVCRNFDEKTTLEFSGLEIWQQAGMDGRSMAYLAHFLEGTGESVRFPLGRLLRDAPQVLNKVLYDFHHGIRAAWRRGDRHDRVRVEQADYGVGTEAQRDWRYALGAISVVWRTKSALSNLMTPRIGNVAATGPVGFHLSVVDVYHWHPETMAGKRTECIHKAGKMLASTGQARDFTMTGECDIEFDPSSPMAPINVDTGGVRVWDVL